MGKKTQSSAMSLPFGITTALDKKEYTLHVIALPVCIPF